MAWQNDPLFVTGSKTPCSVCGAGERDWQAVLDPNWRNRRKLEKQSKRARKNCEHCRGVGFEPISLAGHWSPQPAFLVCAGPSLASLPIHRLKERGIVSLAINNAAAYAPVKAYTFGDPQFKFHGSCHLDAGMMTFCPTGKLRRSVRMKLNDTFRFTDIRMFQCPNMFTVARSGRFNAETFLSTYYCHWGHGGQGEAEQPFRRLATMLMGVRLLHYLGCPRVYMLGVDFKIEKDKPGYAWGAPASCGNKIWWKIDAMLAEIRSVCEDADYHLYNCNPESASKAFDYAPFDIAMQDCKSPVQDEPLDIFDWYSGKRRKADQELYPDAISRNELIDMLSEARRAGG